MSADLASPAPVASPHSAIVEAVRRRASRVGTVIAFADSRYVEVLLNWLVALAAIGIEDYLVVALDAPLHALLHARGIPVVLSELDGDLSQLWIHRIRVFAALCASGLDFVHSDADAVWTRDPRQDYFSDPDQDLVISQGTVWPPDVHRQFGFVLCCGLFGLRSTERTQRLLGDLEQHVLGTHDDQVSLNRLILGRFARWQIKPSDAYYLEGAGSRFLCSRSNILGTCADGLRITLLPHHLFQRVPSRSDESPYVLHPLTPKEPAEKLREFARAGCLLLRPDWRDIGFDVGTLLRLRRGAAAAGP